MFYLHVCLCNICMSGAFESQMSQVDLLRMKLWVVVSHRMVADNQTKSSTRATRALNYWAFLYSCSNLFIMKIMLYVICIG